MSSSSSSSSSSLVVRRLSENARLPARATAGAAGYDLCSAEDEVVIRARGGRACIKTDLAILSFPRGTYARVAARSGLALRHGLDTGAGVIDSDYRGNVCVLLFNHGDEDYVVRRGDRIAQLIVERIAEIDDIIEATDADAAAHDATARGANGFGSTGV